MTIAVCILAAAVLFFSFCDVTDDMHRKSKKGKR